MYFINLECLLQIDRISNFSFQGEVHCIYITFSTFTSVCPYGVDVTSLPTSDLYHVQMSRSPVRPLLSEEKPSYVYSILKPHGQSSRSPVTLLPCKAKPSCVHLILKPHDLSSIILVRLLPRKMNPSYIYSILKQHGQSSKSPIRPMPCKAKLSSVCTIF